MNPEKYSPGIFLQQIEEMVDAYLPSEIVHDLDQMHYLIAGKTGIGNPLFKKLSHEVAKCVQRKGCGPIHSKSHS